MNLKKIRQLIHKKAQIEAEIHEEMKRQIPIGAVVMIEKGSVYEVKVTDHHYGTRLQVQNPCSGKSYPIELSHILNANL